MPCPTDGLKFRAMPRVLRSALMCVLALAAIATWGGGQDAPQISHRWASWFSSHDVQTDTKAEAAAPYQVNLAPTFYTAPVALASVRSLTPDTARTQGLLGSATWLKGMFSTEMEVAANQEESDTLVSGLPAQAGPHPSARMMRFGFPGSSGPLRYGMTYRDAGQAFYNAPDQALREMWGEWKQGAIGLRTAIGRQWNNLGGDPTRSRVEQTYQRIGLSWNTPAWPNLSLTYQQNMLRSALDPIGVAPQRSGSHTIEAALGYTGVSWTARLASSYGFSADLIRPGAKSRVQTETLTASFRPLTTLTIAPTLGYRVERQDWSGVRTDQPSASLTLHYRQSRWLLISAMGNYSSMRSSDHLVDLENIGGKGMLAWELEPVRDWTPLLSLEAGYNLQVNRLLPSTQTEDLSGLLRLVLARL
jgi:hypothetical protein